MVNFIIMLLTLKKEVIKLRINIKKVVRQKHEGQREIANKEL